MCYYIRDVGLFVYYNRTYEVAQMYKICVLFRCSFLVLYENMCHFIVMQWLKSYVTLREGGPKGCMVNSPSIFIFLCHTGR